MTSKLNCVPSAEFLLSSQFNPLNESGQQRTEDDAGASSAAPEDREIEFDEILSAPPPRAPLEISFRAHWLAIEGVQVRLNQCQYIYIYTYIYNLPLS
jgi:hypothetical protein